MSKHTPTPWLLTRDLRIGNWTKGPRVIAEILTKQDDRVDIEEISNGERIVACVNACEELADPSVVPDLLTALKYAEALLSDGDAEEHDADRVLKLVKGVLARAGHRKP